MSKKNDTIVIEAEFIRETKTSMLMDCEGDPEWFPKSQVTFNAEKKELTLPIWLARKTFPNEQY
jgi:hypothetical protein